LRLRHCSNARASHDAKRHRAVALQYLSRQFIGPRKMAPGRLEILNISRRRLQLGSKAWSLSGGSARPCWLIACPAGVNVHSDFCAVCAREAPLRSRHSRQVTCARASALAMLPEWWIKSGRLSERLGGKKRRRRTAANGSPSSAQSVRRAFAQSTSVVG